MHTFIPFFSPKIDKFLNMEIINKPLYIKGFGVEKCYNTTKRVFQDLGNNIALQSH